MSVSVITPSGYVRINFLHTRWREREGKQRGRGKGMGRTGEVLVINVDNRGEEADDCDDAFTGRYDCG